MARVRFTRDFDWRPPVHGVTIAFKAGREYTVKRETAEAALKAGAAVDLEKRKADDGASE